MPLHDTVGINNKNGATAENQGAGVKYVGYGVYVGGLCVCYPTCHRFLEGESHGILLLLLLLL